MYQGVLQDRASAEIGAMPVNGKANRHHKSNGAVKPHRKARVAQNGNGHKAMSAQEATNFDHISLSNPEPVTSGFVAGVMDTWKDI